MHSVYVTKMCFSFVHDFSVLSVCKLRFLSRTDAWQMALSWSWLSRAHIK